MSQGQRKKMPARETNFPATKRGAESRFPIFLKSNCGMAIAKGFGRPDGLRPVNGIALERGEFWTCSPNSMWRLQA